jgi:hypothetical protein
MAVLVEVAVDVAPATMPKIILVGWPEATGTEGNAPDWGKSRRFGGVQGISGADESDDYIVFKAGSRSYHVRRRKP